MKRLLQGAPILTTILLLTMSAGNLWADNSGNDTDALQSFRLVAAATPKSPTASKVGAMKRPVLNSDLAVSAIRVTADCKIQVTIRNNGAGGVPDGAYHPNKGVKVQATAMVRVGAATGSLWWTSGKNSNAPGPRSAIQISSGRLIREKP